MQKSDRNEGLERKLKEELNWYTLYASEEEYDEKAVESILYLLDRWDPLEEGVVPSEKEAWERFQEVVERQQELLPVPEPFETAAQKSSKGAARKFAARARKTAALYKQSSKIVKFMYRHKIVAAVLVLCLILLAGNTIQAVTNPDNGFFFWMRRDDSGIEMFTSPEGLDGNMNKNETIFYDKQSIPEWAQQWIEIESEMELPEDYEWQYYEANEMENRQHVTSYYLNSNMGTDLLLGVWIYRGKVSYSTEGFADYSYVDSYETASKQMDIYRKIEETGESFYIVCFYEGNCKYYVRGQDNLDELKSLIEEYLYRVKNK